MKLKTTAIRGIAVLMVIVMLCGISVTAARANSASDFDLRRKVVSLAGIMSVNGDNNTPVSRQEFARICVLASSYRGVLGSTSNISLYSDVKAGSEYASAIRICADNNWMSGYLGGVFRPEQTVTLYEGITAVLTMLGYSQEYFSGDVYNRRMAKYSELALNQNIYKQSGDPLDRTDTINLIYNLLCCETQTGRDYADTIGASLSSDGQVNPLSMADNSLKGPRYITSATSLAEYLPFGATEASCYLNGEAVPYSTLSSAVDRSSGGSRYLVVYYSPSAKTVWAYNEDGSSESGKSVYHGEVQSILYNSTSDLTPTGVVIDGESFKLSSSDMQFAFSIYGTVKVGEKVTVVYEIATDGGEYVGTVIDYVY